MLFARTLCTPNYSFEESLLNLWLNFMFYRKTSQVAPRADNIHQTQAVETILEDVRAPFVMLAQN